MSARLKEPQATKVVMGNLKICGPVYQEPTAVVSLIPPKIDYTQGSSTCVGNPGTYHELKQKKKYDDFN